MSDNECDVYDAFGIVEDDEQEIAIEFDNECDKDDFFIEW